MSASEVEVSPSIHTYIEVLIVILHKYLGCPDVTEKITGESWNEKDHKHFLTWPNHSVISRH